MVDKRTWDEFKNCTMLWWINMILHTFGWAIVTEVEDDKVISAYPARVEFRGFDLKNNTEGYIGVSQFMNDNAAQLLKESQE